MSTISVQPSTSAAASVVYVVYGSKQGQRAGANRAASFALSMAHGGTTPEQFIERAERLAGARGRKNQTYNYVLAFSPDEFDVTKQEDLDRVRDVAMKFTERMHSADYLVVVHADSAGGHAHAHIIVINNDNHTGKSLQRYTSWKHGLHQLNDELMAEEGLSVLPDPQQTKPDWEQRREQFADGGFEQVLGDKVFDALTDSRSVDRAGFEQVLAEYGVTLAVTHRDGWTYKMRRADNGRLGRKKASGLTPEFTAEGAQQIFDYHAQKGASHESARPDQAGRRTAADYGDAGSIDLDGARRRAASREAHEDRDRSRELREGHGRAAGHEADPVDLAAARARLDAARRRDEEAAERDREDACQHGGDTQRVEDREAAQRRKREAVRSRLVLDDAGDQEADRDDEQFGG